MEKITKEQFEKLANKQKSRIMENYILREIDKLKINEGLKITTEDFKKYFPNTITTLPPLVLQSFRKDRTEKKMTTHTLQDKSGWYVLRIK